jgi:hypothetical protein
MGVDDAEMAMKIGDYAAAKSKEIAARSSWWHDPKGGDARASGNEANKPAQPSESSDSAKA